MTTDSTEHVILVPGFFGFTNLGDLPYFAHVESELQRAAKSYDARFEVSVVSTDPTASLPYRAARVAEHVAHLADQGADRFHIVGHSTGGIDARLLVTPVVTLPTTVDVAAVAAKVRSVISVASPHRGTPLASVFGGRMGQSLLQLFSLTSIAILRRGRVPVYALLRLAGMMDRFRAGRRPNPSAVARLHDQLLADFSPERQAQIEGFLNKIRTDQGLLAQLTPESLEVFNASTPDRPGVRYGCVVTWGRPPGVGTAIKAGLDPYAQATHALYTAVYRLCRGTPARRREVRSPGQDGMLGAAYGVVPTWDASDGMVPTRSQVWGSWFTPPSPITSTSSVSSATHTATRRTTTGWPRPAGSIVPGSKLFGGTSRNSSSTPEARSFGPRLRRACSPPADARSPFLRPFLAGRGPRPPPIGRSPSQPGTTPETRGCGARRSGVWRRGGAGWPAERQRGRWPRSSG